MSNPFWRYSLERYHTPGVAESCLKAQDAFGADVNLLLYAGWLALQQQRLSQRHLSALDSEVACWRQRVVVPLRRLRRELTDLPQAHTLRNGIKDLELAAERQQQDLMWAYYQKLSSLPVGPASPEVNLRVVFMRGRAEEAHVWLPAMCELAALLMG